MSGVGVRKEATIASSEAMTALIQRQAGLFPDSWTMVQECRWEWCDLSCHKLHMTRWR